MHGCSASTHALELVFILLLRFRFAHFGFFALV